MNMKATILWRLALACSNVEIRRDALPGGGLTHPLDRETDFMSGGRNLELADVVFGAR